MSSGNNWYQWSFTPIIIEVISDEGGEDTLHFGSISAALSISLHWGGYTYFGATAGVQLAWGTTIENVNGGSGNDTIYGNNVANQIYSFGGNDVIGGAGGNDVIVTGDGNDWIWGEADNDQLYGQTGNDWLSGGDGNDLVAGGVGDDQQYGDSGDDTLWGEAGNDTLSGGAGHDLFFAGEGDDAVGGDAGDDSIVGEAGNDWIWGGEGNDLIIGGEGHDVLYGGSGADIFVYNNWSRWDTIKDFQQGVDKLRMWNATSFGSLTIKTWGNGVLIEYGDTHIAVENSVIADWNSFDFEFPEAPAIPESVIGTAPENGYGTGYGAANLVGGQAAHRILSINGIAFNDTAAYDSMTATGSTGGTFTVWEYGDVQINAIGAFRDLAVGQTRKTSIEYTYRDQNGQTHTRIASFNITGVNENPVIPGNLTSTTGENAPLSLNGLAGATDIDGDTLSIASVESGGTQTIGPSGSITVTGYNGGQFTISKTGAISFNPGTSFDYLLNGQSAQTAMGFSISDGNGGGVYRTVTVTVQGDRELPHNPTVTGTAPENGWGITNATGSEAGMRMTRANTTTLVNATSGQDSISVTGSAGGIFHVWEYGDIQFNANGQFEDLGVGETRQTSITYAYQDFAGTTFQGTATFTVTGVNDNPIGASLTGSTTENAGIGFNALSGATDIDGDTLSVYSAFSGSEKIIGPSGTLTVKGWGGGQFTINKNGTVAFDPGRDFDYLRPGQTAETTIGVTISDGQGGADYELITVTVSGEYETYVSNTQWINGITLADAEVNGNLIHDWRETVPTYPTGGGLAPAAFFDVVETQLSAVNRIRFVLSPATAHDTAAFNQFKTWVTEAAIAGYGIDIVYADGVRISNDKLPETRMSTEAFNLMKSSWQILLNWVNATPTVKDKIWGYELVNEPEVYRTLTANAYYHSGQDAINYATDLVNLYNGVTGWGDKKIIVGGMGASGKFAVLDDAQMSAVDTRTPIDVIRDTFGTKLVWSAHTYAGWGPENDSVQDWYNTWEDEYYIIAGDQFFMTEGHTRDQFVNKLVNDDGSQSNDHQYARALDWFGERGIGLSWWPATYEQNNFSSDALLFRDGLGVVTPFANNVFWANRAWMADRAPYQDPDAGNDIVNGTTTGDFRRGGDGNDTISGGDGPTRWKATPATTACWAATAMTC